MRRMRCAVRVTGSSAYARIPFWFRMPPESDCSSYNVTGPDVFDGRGLHLVALSGTFEPSWYFNEAVSSAQHKSHNRHSASYVHACLMRS